MTKKLVAVILCILALAPVGGQSDTKVYSPGLCHPVPASWTFTPNTQIDFRWYGSSYGAELSPGSQGQTVTAHCPIVRDVVSNTTGLLNVTVYAYDASPTGQVACSVLSSSPDGVQTFSSATLSTGIAFVNTATSNALNFGPSSTSFNGGHYDVLCTLTAGSISGITYVERAGGNTL
jgi:hypothetical protein